MSRLEEILALPKITHSLVQGSPEWDAFRLEHRGASEAAAVLGLSKKMRRSELLHMKRTGLPREFSEWLQRNVLDKGHEVEALARPHVEALIGEDLYPVACSRGPLSASCDGLTMDDRVAMEHKQWNEELAAMVAAGVLPDEHEPQCQQVLLVTGAEELIFVVSDGTPQRMVWLKVTPDPGYWKRIVDGWHQFDVDLVDYVPPAAAPVIVAEPVQALPAVAVQVTGELVLRDNFKVFETALRDFLEHRLIREPKTDQDFADLDVQIKAMKGAEAALDAAEGQMLAQIQSVDQAKKTKDMLAKLVRDNRLMAEKLLASEKERRRGEIVAGGIKAIQAHIDSLNERLGGRYMPTVLADFAGCIKGLKSLASMEDKVATELARLKIGANEIADKIQANLAHLREHAADYRALFPDTITIVQKAPDDLQSLVAARIAEHRAAEEKHLEAERERIRAEEQAKAQREVEARAAEERRQQENAAREQRQREEDAARAEQQRQQEYTLATAPPSHQTQVPAGTPPAANVVPLPTKAPAAATSTPTLRLGQINERLGFTVTADFLASIGFPVVATDKAAKLWHEHQFHGICAAIAQHVVAVANGQKAAA
jgi:predicted phage-related endonuclease